MKYLQRFGLLARPLTTAFVLSWLLSGCSSLVSSAANSLASDLRQTISGHDDPQIVADAMPSYMLLVESTLRNNPDNVALLKATANLYNVYSSVFVTDLARQQRLAERAFIYGKRAMCQHNDKYCDLTSQQYESFVATLPEFSSAEDLDVLFTLGSAWANKLRVNANDFTEIANLPKITAMMEHVVVIDPEFQKGNAHLYLGVIETLIPPALGGKPEVGKQHFETALRLSKEENLMVHVTYAEQYAKKLFLRELHDELLQKVLNSDVISADYNLSNQLAKQQARALLAGADEYF